MANVLEVDAQNWDREVLQAETPVLVDFWATWCGPCKRLAPTIDEISRELSGRVKVAKLNTDEAGEVATRYGIMSIPTLLVFKGGQVVEQMTGLQTKQAIQSRLEQHLA